MHRRLAATTALLAVLAASLLTAAPAAAAPKANVSTVSNTAPGMNTGQTAWVSVVWKTNKTISDFKVTAAPPPGVTVAYPSGRAFTSLYGSSSLVEKTEDFTALKITIPYTIAPGNLRIPLVATWNYDGEPDSKAMTLTIPLTPYVGTTNLTQLTSSVTVDRSTPTWVQVRFRGAAPSLDTFRVTATGPAGLGIVYPGDGTSAGLNGSSTLYKGLEDYTAFRVDASQLEPGTYALDLRETFNRPGAVTSTGTVSLVVQ